MRIVQAHDAERRRLERNIHDGAQQHLVALAVKLRLAGATASKDPEKAAGQLRDLSEQTDVALMTLLDLASGIYPAELEESGIGPALATQGRMAGVPIEIDVDGVGPSAARDRGGDLLRLPRGDAERREVRASLAASTSPWPATTTASRSAYGTTASGSTRPSIATGTGLQNMRDRLAAFGGDVAISSTPDSGTTVSRMARRCRRWCGRERTGHVALGPMGPDRPRRVARDPRRWSSWRSSWELSPERTADADPLFLAAHDRRRRRVLDAREAHRDAGRQRPRLGLPRDGRRARARAPGGGLHRRRLPGAVRRQPAGHGGRRAARERLPRR